MNILFISSYYPPNAKGGAELSTHYVAQGLIEKGHTVTVVTESNTANDSVYEGVRVIGLPLELTQKPLFEKTHSKKSAHILQEWLSSQTPFDIIHAQDFRSALVVYELHLTNTYVTIRDYAPICGCTNNILEDGSITPGCADKGHLLKCHRVAEASFPRNLFRLWQYWYNQEYRLQAFSSFSNVVYISQAEKKELEQYGFTQKRKTKVIYNPLPKEYFDPAEEKTIAQSVLYVGTVEMYKGVGVLLEAWKSITEHFPAAHLTIVGEGADKKKYEHFVDTNGLQYKVTFEGRIAPDRLSHVYDRSEVVITPHLWVEPFGRTTVEAMARQKIVISSDVGGPAECIEDKKTGFLFKRADAADLNKKIEEVFSMDRYDKKEIQQQALEWTKQNLTSATIAQEYLDFYKNLQ